MAAFINQIPSISAMFSLYTSFSAIMMLCRTVLNELVPKKIRKFVMEKLLHVFSSHFQRDFTFVIEQKWEYVTNQTFRAAEVYLPTRLNGLSTGKMLVGWNNLKTPADPLKVGIPSDTKIVDEFEGIHLEWTLHTVESTKYVAQKRYFHLKCKKEYKEKIMNEYFPYLAESAKKIMDRRENLRIYTYNKNHCKWEGTIFEHHTTFDTLAIEPRLKNLLLEDLHTFSLGRDFFKSVGRSWKRGYLLYGPPGTGKSSLVAAIANHMRYHIYDLQVQSVRDDAHLREILTTTKNRSILLIEDIDCNADVTDSRKCKNSNQNDGDDGSGNRSRRRDTNIFDAGISLSGLLNFVDGLWSSCGEERIIIFTTNHKEELDPALLRPGRMDVHILMDYCKSFVFRRLAALYLRTKTHDLFKPIEKLLGEVNATPAEVTQQLMANKEPIVSLNGLMEFLEVKKKMMLEKKEKEEDEEEKDGNIEVGEEGNKKTLEKMEV